ncbi:MAG: FtsW/RodA/SpoVE family cell cycle protein [Actinomycetota bacterium]
MSRRNAELGLIILAVILSLGAFLLVHFANADSIPAGFVTYAFVVSGVAIAAHLVVRRYAHNADPLLLPIGLLLAGLGYAMVRRLNPDLGGPQLAWIVIGIAAFTLTLVVVRDPRRIESFRYSLMLLGLALLLLPLAPGIGRTVSGARLWVRVGTLNFQPAEGAKILLAAFLAGYLASKREVLTAATTRLGPWRIPAPRHFGPLVLAWGVSLAVMVFERDLGSSMLFFALFVVMLYAATARASYVVTGVGLFAGGTYMAYQAFAHVQNRIAAWIDPWSRIETSGFQIAQSLFALGTGGIGGQGLGRGRPDLIRRGVETDFIFAAFGEELGMVGTLAILLLFGVLVARGFHIALRARDPFYTLLATGLTVIVGIQTFLIVGGVTRLIPLTGITLPFVSYGGSSIVANFVLIALLMRVSDAEKTA